jgi:transcriptional regulator with XRE-family HTH domain
MPLTFAHSEPSRNGFVRCQRDDIAAGISHPANMSDQRWFLKEWRKHRGLSQEALAEAAGTSKGYVSDMESGKRPVPPGRLTERLATALGVQAPIFSHTPSAVGTTSPWCDHRGRRRRRRGDVIQTTGQEAYDMAPVPPGGTTDSVALEVKGHSMRAIAEDGALIYFEDQRTPRRPTCWATT